MIELNEFDGFKNAIQNDFDQARSLFEEGFKRTAIVCLERAKCRLNEFLERMER